MSLLQSNGIMVVSQTMKQSIDWELHAAKEDGNYLVYDFYDENGPSHGNYILLVFCGGKLYLWKISRRQQDGRVILGEDNTETVKSYASVRELIKAHRGITGKPLARLADGQLVKLTCDYVIIKVTDSHNAGITASYRSSIQQRQRRSSDTSEQETPATKNFRPRWIQPASTEWLIDNSIDPTTSNNWEKQGFKFNLV